ncbi:uncharacterized protein LOC119576332 [Penaeus monodon]|uniref:uncharacterized protein LOC119576332 n=1 Tax=Penaeus monodon TaxID=6687 RepID=UPI0018A75592|nr:uncharacterized protein LOC119576332 [Penaeus monodon]
MKSMVIVIAVLAASQAAPQGHGGIRFTQKEYNGLQQALGYRVPVGIYSANQVFSMVEEYPTDYIVLNLPGLSAGGGSGYASRSGIAQARTGALPADDEVADTFSEVAEEAVEAVEEAAEAAEVSINRNLLVQEAVLAMQEQQSAASGGDVVEGRSSSLPATDALNEMEIPSVPADVTGSSPVETAVRSTGLEATTATETETATETMATSAATVTEAATETEATTMMTDTSAQPAAAGLAVDAEEAAAAVQEVAAIADSVRTKRQETELTAVDDLSFALAGLGSLIGSNVGRYLDATFSANVDLIQGFENTGLLVLDQVEDRLRKRQERLNKLRAASSSSSSSNS